MYILTNFFQKLVLLIFLDASELAYGAAIYMHCTNKTSTVTITLIASKSSVALLNTNFIPGLEISACFLLSQFIEKIRLSLKILVNDIYLHTYSKIAIAWINIVANKL